MVEIVVLVDFNVIFIEVGFKWSGDNFDGSFKRRRVK